MRWVHDRHRRRPSALAIYALAIVGVGWLTSPAAHAEGSARGWHLLQLRALPTNARAPASLLRSTAPDNTTQVKQWHMTTMGPSYVNPSRAARYAFLRTGRSRAFRAAVATLGYTDAEVTTLARRLRRWSKEGAIGVQLNPLLGGAAFSSQASVSLSRLLVGGRTLRATAAHELTHLLQEVRFAYLRKEEAKLLTAQDVRFAEEQATAAANLATKGRPGLYAAIYGWLQSKAHHY